MNRSSTLATLCVLVSLALPSLAQAQAGYPNKPIRMIVPLAAGSAVDVAARIVAQKMSASVGQPAEIVARLNAEIARAVADPAVRDQLVAQGLTPRGTSAEALGTATRAQLAKYAALIKKADIKAE